MSIENIRSKIPAFAKDIKINLGNVLDPDSDADLSAQEIACIALSSAYSTGAEFLIKELEDEYQETLSEDDINACKSATAIMGMNNIYYRFLHLASDKEFQTMPANLRMQVIANPGTDKKIFEMCSLAVSAINGCGMCIDSHNKHLEEQGVSKKAIQSTARIASVVNAAAVALSIA